MSRCLLTALVLCCLLCPLAGQYTTADLGGVVLDASGAPVPEAKISARNTATGFTQTIVSGPQGSFLFPRLPAGSYELRVEKEGFATYVQSGITLAVDQAANISVSLQVGQVSNEVTVTGETELVTTRTGTGSQVINEVPIVELPLNGRKPERLMYLAAGTLDSSRNTCRICGQGCLSRRRIAQYKRRRPARAIVRWFRQLSVGWRRSQRHLFEHEPAVSESRRGAGVQPAVE
jgi:hypothetical protein